VYALFEVEGEVGVRQQIGIPVAASWGSPCEVHLPLNMVEQYLDATWLSNRATTSFTLVGHSADFTPSGPTRRA